MSKKEFINILSNCGREHVVVSWYIPGIGGGCFEVDPHDYRLRDGILVIGDDECNIIIENFDEYDIYFDDELLCLDGNGGIEIEIGLVA